MNRNSVVELKAGTDLPPVKVLLVENLENVAAAEAEPCFFTGNQVIVGRVIVEVALYKGLKRLKCWKEGMC